MSRSRICERASALCRSSSETTANILEDTRGSMSAPLLRTRGFLSTSSRALERVLSGELAGRLLTRGRIGVILELLWTTLRLWTREEIRIPSSRRRRNICSPLLLLNWRCWSHSRRARGRWIWKSCLFVYLIKVLLLLLQRIAPRTIPRYSIERPGNMAFLELP